MSVPAQVMVGGWEDFTYLSSVEVFPRPPSDTCFIPNLPEARAYSSLSLLPGGKLVVCGGIDGSYTYNSCIAWVDGNTDWTHYYTMKWVMQSYQTTPPLTSPVRYEILIINRHFLKILILIRWFLKISILILISIRTFLKILISILLSISIRLLLEILKKILGKNLFSERRKNYYFWQTYANLFQFVFSFFPHLFNLFIYQQYYY